MQRTGKIVYYPILPEVDEPGSERSGDVRRWIEDFLLPAGTATRIESEANAYLVATGDGGLMRAARDKRDTGKPVVGINRGRYGFLLNPILSINDLPKDFSQLTIVDLELIQGEFITKEGRSIVYLAFNDIFLGVGAADYSTFKITGERGDFPERQVEGNGIIVATPQGTSAYVLKIRGTAALLPLSAKAWFIAGMATGPYPSDHVEPQKITIEVVSRDRVDGFADGKMQTVENVERVIITPTDNRAQLGFIKGIDLAVRRRKLARKLEIGE